MYCFIFFSSGLDFSEFNTLNYIDTNLFLMLVMLVVATALISSSVHSQQSNEDQLNSQSQYVYKIFSEDDMTPDFTEQLGSHDHTTDIKKQKDVTKVDKYGPPQIEISTTAKTTHGHPITRNVPQVNVTRRVPPGNASDDERLQRNVNHEEIDVVDREDHVTQYLSDHLVNTDSEITSLQASEAEDDRSGAASIEVKEDAFFAFLTGLEKAVEVEGVWSRPNVVDYTNEVQKIPEQNSNAASDVD